ncbi:FAD-binding oxidoreductase [Herbiconiux sp. L3-i23]|uniref:FAD-binding oxidoreductase n=1 Tax=Herbiconiux sp. L3-i23 TaxID=2905871 RepID=UPI0020470B51|nr:FAD-binding oxidoreductase [Herbiconiux sp. L3-i23]BDI23129.1 oxidoreductase [Herbiconiux sp. L3-i23]
MPSLAELRTLLPDSVRIAGDPDFESIRADFAYSGEPSVMVCPASAEEVSVAVRYAASEGLGVTIRSGGHGGKGFRNPDGMVIDLRRLASITVYDDDVVRIGGGATWGDVATALGARDLALSSGDTASVGVGGLTLGGGVGWLVRQYGLALDSLIGAEVVLANGEVVTASETENPVLFWALRGGGGNFGVVTSFVFQAHPLSGVVFGALTFRRDDLGPLLRGWRDVLREAPVQFNSTVMALPPFDGGDPTVAIHVCHAGDAAAADPWIGRLRRLPGLLSEEIVSTRYESILEEEPPPMGPITIVGDNAFADDFDDATVDALLAAIDGLGASVLMIRFLRGAFNEVGPDDTAFAYRGAEVLLISAAFLPLDAPADAAREVHTRWGRLAPHTNGTYGNFSMEPGDGVTTLMYPPKTLARLRRAKRRYDPDNLFSRNHNVRVEENVAL